MDSKIKIEYNYFGLFLFLVIPCFIRFPIHFMMISFLFGQPQKISGTLLFYFSNMISISWLSAHSINYNIHINALTHWRAHTHTLTHAQIGFNSDCSVLFKRFLFSLIPIFAYIEVYRGDVNFDW